MSWTLTIRHGSKVRKQSLDSLDQAIAEARASVAAVIAEGPLGSVSAFKDYGPESRIHARVEVSQGRGVFRRWEGGIDVMGDGSVVAYTGGIRKKPIEADSLDQACERLRDALG